MKRILFLTFIFFTMISFSIAQSDSIEFTWDANTETDLAGYKWYKGMASRTYDEPVDVGNQTSYTTGIAAWQDGTYYFAVTAYDTAGNESGYSNEVSYEVNYAAPAPPIGCTVRRIP